MKKLVFIADIDIKQSPDVRACIRDDVVEDYMEAYKSKEKLPPIQLFQPNGEKFFLISDGRHRLEAQRLLKRKAIEADVQKGDFSTALTSALVANQRHGLRRSNEDKRRCIEVACKQWPDYSHKKIADVCCVSSHTVASVMGELQKKGEVKETTVRTDAKGRKMNVSRIGKSRSPSLGKHKVSGNGKQITDSLGNELTPIARECFKRAPEVQEMLTTISTIKGRLEQAQKQKDLMYVELSYSTTIGDLEKVYASIKMAKPYALCPQCQGHPDVTKCSLCRGRGVISQFRYDHAVPVEFKKMVTKKKK